MNKRYGAIVIGGGYFGCAAAYFLAKAGIKTLLLEQKEVASGASGANFGNVQVQDSSMGLNMELTLAGFRKMQTMEQELGCSIGYRPCPSLIVAEHVSHMEELEKLYREKKEAGLDIQLLSRTQVAQLEPNINPAAVYAATYYVQGLVYPFHYMFGLVKRARQQYGLHVREFAPVASLLMEGRRCAGVALESGEEVPAKHVIVTAGAGTEALCQTAGLRTPVRAVKAEAFATEAIQPFMNTYYSSAAFFAEAHDEHKVAASLCVGQSHYGNMLVGETTKPPALVDAQQQDCASIEHYQKISAQLCHLFPQMKDVKILRSWATASPFTPSNEPAFGNSPVPGLILAAGFKSAVVMSALAGELIADLVTKGRCRYDLSQYMAHVHRVHQNVLQ